MPTALESAQHVLQTQPFSILLAAQLTAFSADYVEVCVPITAQVKQQFGFVHGGVISYAADNALTFAGKYALGPSIVTSDFKVNYVCLAKGKTLITRTHMVYAGQSQAVCRCDVFAVADGNETLCAVAQGTIAAMRKTA